MIEPTTVKGQGSALLVVDVQNDFCEGGALQVSGGVDVAHGVARYMRMHAHAYDLLVASRDWHIDPGDHFAKDPDFVDSWPPHCVAGTIGADFHPVVEEVLVEFSHRTVSKGMHSAAYSVFEAELSDGKSVCEFMLSTGIGRIDIVGLCTDYCVARTAFDAASEGFAVRVLVDLTAGVHPDSTRAAIENMKRAGVEIGLGFESS